MGPLELQFFIDDRLGVLRAADISAALGLRIPPANAEGYRDWAHPPQREMVRILARYITAEPVLFRRQLPPQMLLIDHLLRTDLFPLQHYVQRRGAILEALYRISEGYWFSPSELVMTSLMHFKEKVHRKGPGSSRESSAADAETTMPGPRALGFSGGAPDREEDSMPSGLVDGASDDHTRIFSPSAARPGGGTRSGGRGLPQR